MVRLKVKGKKSIAAQIEDISGRITKISPSRYSVWLIEKLMDDVEQARNDILGQLKAIEQKVMVDISEGNTGNIEEVQFQVKQLKRRDQSLQEEYQRLFNYRQAKILRDRITQKIGGTFNYQLKEALITLLVIFVLILMAYEYFHPELSDQTLQIFFWIDASCCTFFLTNFFFELSLADSKAWFWKRYCVDFITSIPIPIARGLRIFRGLRIVRLLRFVRFLRLLRLLRILLFFWRGLDHLAQMFNVRLMRKSLMYVCISLVAGAIAFQFFEGTGSPIDQKGVIASLWWSFTTVVTGGFADIHNPVTMGGKILTVILVILGMVIIGIFTATLTSVMVGEEDDLEQLRLEINEHFEQLIQRIERIECRMNRTDNVEDHRT
ncbi:MAG: potassium channel family protein [Leptolyngbyaceae cyanobacterium]